MVIDLEVRNAAKISSENVIVSFAAMPQTYQIMRLNAVTLLQGHLLIDAKCVAGAGRSTF
jgi:hypothetical protein